jgi:hypothetical protein
MTASRESLGGAATVRPVRWLSIIDGVRDPDVTMLLWGIVVGLLGALALFAMTPTMWPTTSSRAMGLRDAYEVLRQGGPLLLGRHGATGALYAVGVSDDQGIYVYVPLLSRLFGVTDPVSMLRYSYVVLYGLTTAAYPIVFFRLTRSLLAGIMAPLMLLVCVRAMLPLDIYWIPAWGMFTLLPAIYLLARDWPRFGLVALVGITLVASWLSSIRSEAGLPIVIAAAIVLLLRRWRWWRLLPALALLAVVYISINTFVLSAIRAHRDHQVGSSLLDRNQPTEHPLWHTLYIGIGYLPNKYGLWYEDSVGMARVQREAPGTVYLSSHYASVIRAAYLSFIREHPLEVMKQYAAKAVVAIANTVPYIVLVLFTLPAMLLLGPELTIRRRWILLTLPAVIIMFLPSMIAIPTESYEEGLFGALGVIGILNLCWILERFEFEARKRGGLHGTLAALRSAWSASKGQPSALRRSARISCMAMVVLTVLCVGGHFIRRSSERWEHESSNVLIDDVSSGPFLSISNTAGEGHKV